MSFIYGNNTSVSPITGGVVVTSYLSAGSGTHNLNANTKLVEVYLWGSGAGGDGGATNAAGTNAGSAGSTAHIKVPVSFLGGAGASVSYTVGAGGAGGISGTTIHPGSNGNITSFGYISVPGGIAVSNGFDVPNYQACARTSAGQGGGVTSQRQVFFIQGTGGGNGNSGAVYAGDGTTILIAGAIKGADGNGNPGANGNNGFPTYMLGGTGGAGGGNASIAGDVGGNGGAGGFPGAGGGAGGKGDSISTTGGAGGNGANGAIYVIEYL